MSARPLDRRFAAGRDPDVANRPGSLDVAQGNVSPGLMFGPAPLAAHAQRTRRFSPLARHPVGFSKEMERDSRPVSS